MRQVTGIHREKPGRLELRFQKFGKGPPGTLVVAASKAASEQLERRSQRLQFSKVLRRWLLRMEPQWKLLQISSEPMTAQSLSGRYTRAVQVRGNRAWAVMGVGEHEDRTGVDGILTFGLIWLDWLRMSSPNRVLEGLKLFVPRGQGETTARRIRWLNPEAGRWEIYEMGEDSVPLKVEDAGNLSTRVVELRQQVPLNPETAAMMKRVEEIDPAVKVLVSPGGEMMWAVRGLKFARQAGRKVVFGVERAETALEERTEGDLMRLAGQLVRVRKAGAAEAGHPLYRLQSERWMQSMIVEDPETIHPELVKGALHEQVLVEAGLERGQVDLLGGEPAGAAGDSGVEGG